MMSKIDDVLVGKAVNALIKYEVKKANDGGKGGKSSLLGSYAKPVLVQIQLNQNISKPVSKPVRVKIPNSMFSPEEEDHTVCFFCRSDDKEAITNYHVSNPIPGVTKIVSINEVKKHFKQLKDLKALKNEHTHFACDARIAPQLYNLLGKTFSARHNYPVQINYSQPQQLPALITKVVESSYFYLGGNTLSIRLGHTNMDTQSVLQNIVEGVPFAIDKLQRGWADVHSVHLKTNDSASLPIYSKTSSEMTHFMETHAQSASTTPKAIVSSKSASEKSRSSTVTPGGRKKDKNVSGSTKIPTIVSGKKRASKNDAEVEVVDNGEYTNKPPKSSDKKDNSKRQKLMSRRSSTTPSGKMEDDRAVDGGDDDDGGSGGGSGSEAATSAAAVMTGEEKEEKEEEEEETNRVNTRSAASTTRHTPAKTTARASRSAPASTPASAGVPPRRSSTRKK